VLHKYPVASDSEWQVTRVGRILSAITWHKIRVERRSRSHFSSCVRVLRLRLQVTARDHGLAAAPTTRHTLPYAPGFSPTTRSGEASKISVTILRI
jgi:hypothetical protein